MGTFHVCLDQIRSAFSVKSIDAFCMTYNILSMFYVFKMPDAGVMMFYEG